LDFGNDAMMAYEEERLLLESVINFWIWYCTNVYFHSSKRETWFIPDNTNVNNKMGSIMVES